MTSPLPTRKATDMNENLLPCPFCGGESAIEQTGKNELTIRCVETQTATGLKGCGPKYVQRVTARFSLDWLAAKMAETWNRRPPPPHSKLVAEVLTVDMDAPLTAVDRLRALAGGSRDIAFEPSDADEILEKLEALAAILSAPNLEIGDAPAPAEHVVWLDDATKQKLRESLRFAASRSVMSSDDERRILAAFASSSDVAAALSAVIEGWDFWEVAPHDREPPRNAIHRARAALASAEGTEG